MRVQFDQSTPLGSTKVTLMTDACGVKYEAVGAFRQALQIPWSSITSAGTAVLDLTRQAGTLAGPLAPYMQRREMLVVAYREPGGRKKDVSLPLPAGEDRNALVAEARSSLGSRWTGEEMPFHQVRNRLGAGSSSRTALVWLFILGVALAAFVALFAGALLLAILANHYMLCLYAFAGGGLVFRHGFIEYRNRLEVLGTPTAKATSAAIGLAELFGRARGRRPTAAPLTGTPSVFWSVEVRRWHKPHDNQDGNWQTIFKKESDPLDTFELEDETGRIPIWSHRAELILKSERWESQKGVPLPEPGWKLLDSLGVKWPPASDPNHVVATEKRLAEDGPVYVMGTLAERWRIPSSARQQPAAVAAASLSAVPGLAWIMFRQWIVKKVRGRAPIPPDLEPNRVLIWKGDQGRPFIISDRPERDTLRALSKRMWISLLVGAGLMAGGLYAFLNQIVSS